MRDREDTLSETTGNTDRIPPTGQSAMFMAGLAIGVLLLGLQLWSGVPGRAPALAPAFTTAT
jgi:hypothetical protein